MSLTTALTLLSPTHAHLTCLSVHQPRDGASPAKSASIMLLLAAYASCRGTNYRGRRVLQLQAGRLAAWERHSEVGSSWEEWVGKKREVKAPGGRYHPARPALLRADRKQTTVSERNRCPSSLSGGPLLSRRPLKFGASKGHCSAGPS